ncbi:Eukaryotic translation initiation factor 3 subunit B [Micractinium conductrix]|uniref:Eukaryotic translation initiation factor 3 subunit B n=1 Tax=Micractinium conductrix TaxID=554055 RepID=A0A2P6VCV0_9CHLO|nr:Eukaryotic translation initiation factor 3 subunit B [Micractinium conductrix]|eukprot:PSC71923.1 Eukaryotic translation initiation factor 3 subunit B [Micractinium conductrix]
MSGKHQLVTVLLAGVLLGLLAFHPRAAPHLKSLHLAATSAFGSSGSGSSHEGGSGPGGFGTTSSSVEVGSGNGSGATVERPGGAATAEPTPPPQTLVVETGTAASDAAAGSWAATSPAAASDAALPAAAPPPAAAIDAALPAAGPLLPAAGPLLPAVGPADGWRLPADGAGCQRLLWFMTIGTKDPNWVEEYGSYVKAALLSARRHAPSLVPVLLVTSAGPTELGTWFGQLGGLALLHHLSFLPLMPREADPARTLVLEGVFLRLDAHLRYALYTDTDVVFMGGGPAPAPHPGDISTCTVPLPQLFSIGAEMERGEIHNSGVMVLNTSQMHEEMPAMVRHAYAASFQFNLSVLDQGFIHDYLKQEGKRATQLPDRLNFKAYWGGEPGITIVHFHGPKPRRCTPCFLEHRAAGDWQTNCTSCPGSYLYILQKAVDADGGQLYETMSSTYEMYQELAAMPPEQALSVLRAEQQLGAAGADEQHLFEGQPKGFPFGDFDLADVMLPEDDDMGIPCDSDDEGAEEELQTESGFGNVLVVDNLPAVSQEKYEKLTAILTKIFSGSGRILEGGLFHPQDSETKMSKGYAFVEYENAEQAKAAQAALNGYQLDKAHKFAATLFDEVDRLAKVPEQYQEPEERTFTPGENLLEWLGDKRGRDQFVARYGDETEVCWNDAPKQQEETVYKRSFWTEAFVEWTPHGSMLTTVHRQGVAMWGGKSFERLQRLGHPGVQRLLWSACEQYLLTFSEFPDNRGRPAFVCTIWEARTGKRLRTFEGPHDEYAVGFMARGDHGMRWPAFRWSGGEGGAPVLLAHMKKNAISVYAAPDMGMLDKKSLKLENVQDWEWSPNAADTTLVAYQGEQENLPARVVLIHLPDRAEIRQKNLFSVAALKMTWHPQGDYLAVQVDKWTKTKKSTHTNFELFSLREKDCPIDMLELPNKSEKIMALTWEPKGHRFAVLHGEGSRPSVSIYTMKDTKPSAAGARGVTLLHTMTNKQCTSMNWSPSGRFLVLAGISGGHNGALEFWDCEEMALLNAGEHFMCQEVHWDPTGRYVATVVNAAAAMENGFMVWSFSGQLLYKTARDRFFQLLWRPRPPSLLPQEKQKEIVKSLRKYSKRYEEEDEALLAQADSEFVRERERQLAEFRDWLASKQEYAAKEEAFFKEQLGERLNAHDHFTVQEVEVSVVLDVKEEAVKQ